MFYVALWSAFVHTFTIPLDKKTIKNKLKKSETDTGKEFLNQDLQQLSVFGVYFQMTVFYL